MSKEIDIYAELDNFVEENEGEVSLTDVAKHFTEYSYKYAIENVCLWLKQHSFDYLIRDMYDDWIYDDETMIKDIRKELEERI